jgi:hypothetical protein
MVLTYTRFGGSGSTRKRKKAEQNPFATPQTRYQQYLDQLGRRWAEALGTRNTTTAATPFVSSQRTYTTTNPKYIEWLQQNTPGGSAAPRSNTPADMLLPGGGTNPYEAGQAPLSTAEDTGGTDNDGVNTTGPGSGADISEYSDRWFWENPQAGVGKIFGDLGWSTDIRDPFLRTMNDLASAMPDLFLWLNPEKSIEGENLDVLGFKEWMENYFKGMKTPGGNPAGFVPQDIYNLISALASGEEGKVHPSLQYFLTDNPDAASVAARLSDMIAAMGATALNPTTVEAMQGMLNQLLYDYSVYYPGEDNPMKFAQFLIDRGFLRYFFGV